MSFKHVEDTKEQPITWFRNGFGVRVPAATTRHSVWRCEHCKALAVGQYKASPPSKCGKCKR